MQIQQFYRQLGNLMYAVAAADRNIRNEEIMAVKDLVKGSLVHIEENTDEFGSDSVFMAEFQFEFCLDTGLDPMEVYEEFEDFIKSVPLTAKQAEVCLRASSAVASAFYGVNKSELCFLERVQNDLRSATTNLVKTTG